MFPSLMAVMASILGSLHNFEEEEEEEPPLLGGLTMGGVLLGVTTGREGDVFFP